MFAQGCDASRQGVVDAVTTLVASVSSDGFTVDQDDELGKQIKKIIFFFLVKIFLGFAIVYRIPNKRFCKNFGCFQCN